VLQLSLEFVTPKGVTLGLTSRRDHPINQFRLLLWQVRLPIPWGSLAIQEIVEDNYLPSSIITIQKYLAYVNMISPESGYF